MLWRNLGARSIVGAALSALLVLSACTFTIQPEAGTGAATAAPQEEASGNSSELVGPTWQWIQTQYGDDSVVTATDPSRYSLQFNDDGTVAVQLDCNSGSGTYTVDGPSLTFGPIASTLMGCPDDSQADVFGRDLGGVVSYTMQDGHLFLAIKLDTGIMEFAPAGESGEATVEATEEPSEEATVEPTEEATVEPTEEATEEATEEPSEEATAEPTEEASGVLTGTTWLWEKTVITEVVVTPTDPSRYTITFNDDGTTNIQLDCNSGRATFTLVGDKLTLGPILSTRMACPADSQDAAFGQNLADALSYSMGDGTLRLNLKNDGVMDLTEQP